MVSGPKEKFQTSIQTISVALDNPQSKAVRLNARKYMERLVVPKDCAGIAQGLLGLPRVARGFPWDDVHSISFL